MRNLESLKATGELRVVLTDANGQVKEDHLLKNLVVDTGLHFIVSRMKDTTDGAMSHMSLGTGTTDAAHGDTTLGAEIAASRVL